MALKEESTKVQLKDTKTGIALFGPQDSFLKLIEQSFPIRLTSRGEEITLFGPEPDVKVVKELLNALIALVERGIQLTLRDIHYAMDLAKKGMVVEFVELFDEQIAITAKGKPIRAKTIGQRQYITAIKKNDIVFGIGPAGTGKTYLAVVLAVSALKNGFVKKVALTRPAVEAGENLGFLPGDLQEKVDPYLRPLYDALHDVLGLETVGRMMERGIIEIAPLAYMRGRTLEDSFVILDEAQNTTPEQMKMFLTRLGFGSKMVITGDVTQIDLPRGKRSGLKEAERILNGVEGIYMMHMSEADVVRHPLVHRVIQAYAKHEEERREEEPIRKS
ncbi:phosphate starvation-inducible protein PhoH [Ammoniphilus oxalaticus]|uniref:PhoH-like protein n=1 Tax=Ammoniphilus oxalaticus TaxID=66863 RepID=A0A419SJ38_9BACL|nr:PhoH family protein [Ammoniphilus oxalaticus]RKD24005.1 phosphate starvation-inducible protein PhoH [Ammoniphilus oxalaticus]